MDEEDDLPAASDKIGALAQIVNGGDESNTEEKDHVKRTPTARKSRFLWIMSWK